MLYHVNPITLEMERTMLNAMSYLVKTYTPNEARDAVALLLDGYAAIREVRK